MGKIYGYARVSTAGQEKNGNSLENQEKQLKDAGAEVIYKDAFTGTRMDRPELKKLLEKLQEGDTLIITKLDRVARSLMQGSQLIGEIIEKGIKVNILNIGVMDNTPSSKLIRHIFFAFAEFERDMLFQRTQEGKAIAKTKEGYSEGRPKKYTKEQIEHALNLFDNGNSLKQVARMTKISESTIVRAKRARKAKELKDQMEGK